MTKTKRLDRFILNYMGNKYRETKKYLSTLNIDKYDYICEAYGGIFGFSRVLFELNPQFKGKFMINDVDKQLIDFFNLLKTDFDKTLNDLETKVTEIWSKCDNLDKNFSTKIKLENNRIISLSCRSLAPHLMSHSNFVKKMKNFREKKTEYIRFFDKITFHNLKSNDFFKLVEGIQSGPKLMFHDPPYINSNNRDYVGESISINNKYIESSDSTALYILIKQEFDKKINDNIMIINHTAIMDYVFMQYFSEKYSKIYSNCSTMGKNKKKTKSNHAMYTNKSVVIT